MMDNGIDIFAHILLPIFSLVYIFERKTKDEIQFAHKKLNDYKFSYFFFFEIIFGHPTWLIGFRSPVKTFPSHGGVEKQKDEKKQKKRRSHVFGVVWAVNNIET